MDFGDAIKAMKNGERVTRKRWDGKGWSVGLQRPDEHSKITVLYLFMGYPSTPASDTAPTNHINAIPWLASHTDMLAEDWEVVQAQKIKDFKWA